MPRSTRPARPRSCRRLPRGSDRSSSLPFPMIPSCFESRSRFGLSPLFERLEGAYHLIKNPIETSEELPQQLVSRRQLPEPFHVGGVDRLTVDQPDPDGRLLMLLGELSQHLGCG